MEDTKPSIPEIALLEEIQTRLEKLKAAVDCANQAAAIATESARMVRARAEEQIAETERQVGHLRDFVGKSLLEIETILHGQKPPENNNQ